MDYLSFLQFVLSFGDKLPQAIKLLQSIFADAKALVALFTPPGADPAPADGDLQMVARTAEEEQLENQIVYALSDAGETQAMVNPMFLLELWRFAQKHPEIIAFVKSVLASLKK